MEIEAFGKMQSVEQHLREQIDKNMVVRSSGKQGLNDLGIILRAALNLLSMHNQYHQETSVKKPMIQETEAPKDATAIPVRDNLFVVWATIIEHMENGSDQTFEATVPVWAATTDAALEKFTGYWAKKSIGGVSFEIVSADVAMEIR